MRFIPCLVFLLILTPVLVHAQDLPALPTPGMETPAESAPADENAANPDEAQADDVAAEPPEADVAVQNIRQEEKRIPLWVFIVGGAVIGGILGALYSVLGGGKKAS